MTVTLAGIEPYPGLRAFDLENRDFFFGREAQTDALVGKLRHRFVAVVGASGCGKSSLVRAGLRPRLEATRIRDGDAAWRVAVMQPQGRPIPELAGALLDAKPGGREGENADVDLAELCRQRTAAMLRHSSRGLADAVNEFCLPPGAKFLLIVDQFEEIFRFRDDQTAPRTSEEVDEATAFVRLLLRAAREEPSPVHVLLTMRLDFLGDCARFQGLPEAINDGQFLVPSLRRAEQRAAIEKPARQAGKRVCPALVQVLLDDAGEEPDRLPVLQHALMRLWRRAEQEGLEILEISHYHELGGMDRALSDHASDVYNELNHQQQHVAERLFKAITDVDREGRAVRRPRPLGELAAVAGASLDAIREVVEAFRAPGRAFLRPPPGTALIPDHRVDIAHESLMHHWSMLRGDGFRPGWLAEAAAETPSGWLAEELHDGAIYRGLLTDALEGERTGEMLQGARLQRRLDWWHPAKRNEAWAERYGDQFKVVKEYLGRSKQRASGRSWIMRSLALVSSVVLVVLLSYIWYQGVYISHLETQRLADRRLVDLLATRSKLEQAEVARETLKRTVERATESGARERARRLAVEAEAATTEGDALKGLTLALEALTGRYRGETLPYLPEAEAAVYSALQRLESVRILHGHGTSEVNDVAFSPDGTRIATAADDNTARIWDTATGEEDLVLRGHKDLVYSAAFSPDGSRVVTASVDQTARVWDAATGEELLEVRGHENIVNDAVFSPDGARIVTASDDGTARVWDALTGDELLPPLRAGGSVRSVAFSPGGTRIATASKDRKMRIWDAATGKQELELQGSDIGALSFARLGFSPDGQRLVTASTDGTARIWDAAGGSFKVALSGHDDAVLSAAFNADGTLVLTGSEDRTARVWEAATGREVRVLRGHGSRVYSAVFGFDAALIATASADSTARLWFWQQSPPLAPLRLAEPTRIARRAEQVGMPGLEPLPDAAEAEGSEQDPVVLAFGSAATLLRADSDSLAAWSVADGELLFPHLDFDEPARPLAVWSDGASGAILAEFGSHTSPSLRELRFVGGIREVRFEPGNEVLRGAGRFTAGAVRSDGAGFAAASATGQVLLVDVRGPTPVWHPLADKDEGLKLAFANSGQLLAVSDGGQAWRVSEHEASAPTLGPAGRVIGLDADQQRVITFRGPGTAGQSSRIASTILVWDARTGDVVARLPLADARNAVAAALSPDGRRLLTAHGEATVRLWDLRRDEPSVVIGRFEDPGTALTAVAYAPDGRKIAAAADGRVVVWRVFPTTEALVGFANDAMPPGMTNELRRSMLRGEEP